MKRTSIRLADGRELLYYDESDPSTGATAVRALVDPRTLPPRGEPSEIRRDPLVDEWVVIASHRQDRTFLPPTDECPLDPSRDGRQTEIPADDYDVVVFENRFPSLSAVPAGVDGGGPDRRPGLGRCEVVCFTPDHDGTFAALSARRLRTVVDVWADRTLELGRLPGVVQVFPFENRGVEIGVTLTHPHGQVYAYPYVTPRTARMLAVAAAYRSAGGGCLQCAVVAVELAGPRVIATTATCVAYVPAAARWPFEVHVVPRRHVPDLPALGGQERDEIGQLYAEVLGRLDRVFDVPMPYVGSWYQAPAGTDPDLSHLHVQVFSSRRSADKLKYLAASESAAGAFINDVRPEEAAALLRDQPAVSSRTRSTSIGNAGFGE